MRQKLTEVVVVRTKPHPSNIVEIFDANLPGFGLRIMPKAGAVFSAEDGWSGSRSFFVMFRHAGKQRRLGLGKAAPKQLGAAREKAREALRAVGRGGDPAQAKEERKANTFRKSVEQFIEQDCLAGLRSGGQTESWLRREFVGQARQRVNGVAGWRDGPEPIWRDRPITAIARRDVVERLDEIKKRGGKHAARGALAAVRKFFNWCIEGERFGVEVSPCANVSDKTIGFSQDRRELKRKRVLRDDELRDVWIAAGQLTKAQKAKAPEADVFDPVDPLAKLLMLTGQRLNDIACARWPEIDIQKATLTVPPERYKTDTAHEVPLSQAALDIIKALPRFKHGYVLTTTAGARPVSGFAKMKARLDAAVAELRAKDGAEVMAHWTLHDLRRTLRTRLVSDCKVDAFIAERVIGHALPGLHRVYDQGTHRDQKRDALERWAAQLAAIIDPPPSNGGRSVQA